MDYFTRAWASGDLTDIEFDEVLARYQDYLGSLDPSGQVHRFATTVSPNDAWVDQFALNTDQISLWLLTGDLQHGYLCTEILYIGARILRGQDALDRAIQHRPTEIWYDEFSGNPPSMVHRFLLVRPGGTEDEGEVHIEFSELRYINTLTAGRLLPPL